MEAFRMATMAFGNVVAQGVYVAAKLGIADLLEAGPKSVDELARASGAHAPSLGRLLRALASLAVFDSGMAMISATETAPIAAAYDFSTFARVIDVGGGRGGFLAAILRAHPEVRGALYDLPHVVKEATLLDAPDLQGRTSRLGGDFLQSVPALFDAYVLKRVLHDWDDDTCIAILRRC